MKYHVRADRRPHPGNRSIRAECIDDLGFAHMKDSDFEAVSEDYISITPIHLDLTNHASFREMKDWKF
ncbi:MAG: 5'-nucleotidase SurE [Deltaproteobacteria bacterium]|nr:5'-nucleotidase SurE [Deltaproteobacteria bacterium]